MNIPPRYQVFPQPVQISAKDEQRLRPHLSGWEKLWTFLSAGVNDPDLKRLVIMELLGAQRPMILERLLARLGKVQRAELDRRIQACLVKRGIK